MMNQSLPHEFLVIGDVHWCVVPEGDFLRGSSSAPEEGPTSTIFLDSYAIMETPVTNQQYRLFIKETGWWRPPLIETEDFGADDQSVVTVSWYDAISYCKWFSERFAVSCTLPTEAQWEKAARGNEGQTYPWGDSPPNHSRLNIDRSVGKTTPVGKYGIRSPYGALDMLGNIWEWCLDWYYPQYYKQSPSINPTGAETGISKVIRGGSWRSDRFRATCAHRCYYHPNVRSDRHGFRVVLCLNDSNKTTITG